MAKQQKIEQYGPRNCPLVRSLWMTDRQWADAKVEFDATMRRMGKKITWRPKPPQTCRQCGTAQGPFGVASGLCPACRKEALAEVDAIIRRGR